MKKFLIINSDSPNNRGDRAILLGSIELIRKTYGEEVEIWALSEFPQRDRDWYGINFIPIPVQSLSLRHLIILLKRAKEFEKIFWGGGEFLKDYTNMAALIYWTTKIYLISIVNPEIIGMFQGIGPTNSELGKQLIKTVVNRCKVFFTRDKESKVKLLKWGVTTKIVASFDPAILEHRSKISSEVLRTLNSEYQIDSDYLNNYIGIGTRNWFHYKKRRWLPYRYQQYFPFASKERDCESSLTLQKNLAILLDEVIDALDTNIIFFPMHMSESENDVGTSKAIIRQMKNGSRTRVLEKDNISPQEYLNVIGQSRLFIGVRLHSTILSTVANIPSFIFYYVDKGRLYFEQIGLSEYAVPIENLLNASLISDLKKKILMLTQKKESVQTTINKSLLGMRKQIMDVFSRELDQI